jgi:hypothetical protein
MLRHVLLVASVVSVLAGCAVTPGALAARNMPAADQLSPTFRATAPILARTEVEGHLRRARLCECRIAFAPPLSAVAAVLSWRESVGTLTEIGRHWAMDTIAGNHRTPTLPVKSFAADEMGAIMGGHLAGWPNPDVDSASRRPEVTTGHITSANRPDRGGLNAELCLRLSGLAFLLMVLLMPVLCSSWAARNGRIEPLARLAMTSRTGDDISAIVSVA